ncbi:M-phase inducer phosphatase 3 [Pyxicephalus adspersus]|uniref:Uncharacterized protein n=1 Tax=Pyxicephalus adspersus TaxID=30357 RepID=A0AAV3B5C7_PYXAD|nr:TPA: hypothetical protein GDO54_006866 [Pyxicephalus adspersus]
MADGHSFSSSSYSKSSGLNFRANCRMVLNLLRDKDASVIFSPEQPLTPVTDLAKGFSNLNTFNGETPKRCLDLSNLSFDEPGLQAFMSPVKTVPGEGDSPKSQSVQLEDFFTPEPANEANRKCLKGTVNTSLPRLLCSTPSFKKVSGRQKDSSNKENVVGLFKNPAKLSSALLLREAAVTPIPPTFETKDDLCTEDDSELQVLASPISAAPGVDEAKVGNFDGFSEFFAMEEEEEEAEVKA